MSYKLIHGECLEEMQKLNSDSVDTIITDPPYGLSFMGKKWDYDVPSVELWKEALRVLKPGGTALIFAGSRTQHRMAVNVEDAGFVLKDTIMYLYGSGFPKATDISKQLDKGHERKVVGQTDINVYKKDKGSNFTLAENADDKSEGYAKADITEPATPEAKLWNGWKSHGLKPAYEPIIVAMKPNDGTYANNALKHGVSGLNIDGGRIGSGTGEMKTYKVSDMRGGNFGQSKEAYQDREKLEYKQEDKGRFPANILLDEEAAKMLDEQSGVLKVSGAAKTGRKNLSGKDYSNQDNIFGGGIGKQTGMLHNDKGGASRFFYCAKSSKRERNNGLDSTLTVKYHSGICQEENTVAVELLRKVTYDTEIVNFNIDESGENIMGQCHKGFLSTILTKTNKTIELKTLNSLQHFITNGFIQDANSEVKIGGNPAESVESLNKYLQIITKGNQESALGVSRAVLKMLSLIKEEENWKPLTNIHSTVKPLALMEYLCTLTKTPTGGIVLDPFMGSGTTGIACQNTGREFVGIEREEEYIAIAGARMRNVPPKLL